MCKSTALLVFKLVDAKLPVNVGFNLKEIEKDVRQSR